MSEGNERDDGRRGALKRLVVLGTAALGCAVAAPAAVFLAAPVKRGGGGAVQWVNTVRLEALREGEPRKVSIIADQRDAWTVARDVDLGAVWLVRTGDKVQAWSAVCPHLGCAIAFVPASGFACPCHDSSFGSDGSKESGPSPRGMDPLEVKVEEGVVEVGFQRFRIGTPAREAIG
ncbi:MAG TPA: Rieske (2Fe-2S) protein [Polyangiaceae bacterium]|jgi:cytochrome b6-f complex iron-sulfur subunit/menaquinol-cytochrome c reductase iron-sulfur subunit